LKSLTILNFSENDQIDLFRIIAAILHLGNISLVPDREDNASLTTQAGPICEKVCHVLGIPVAEFTRSLLKPKIKAGRDWVTQAKSVEQVYYSIEALSRSLYERMFSSILDRVNQTLFTPAQKVSFVGVLDIAGFEIFEVFPHLIIV
jgi:myosin protein heavy chain